MIANIDTAIRKEKKMKQNDKNTDIIVKTKCQSIRELYAAGNEIKEIAKILKIRYQFVYNVVKRLNEKQLGSEVWSVTAEQLLQEAEVDTRAAARALLSI